MPQVEPTTVAQDLFVVFGVTLGYLFACSACLRVVNGRGADRFQWEFILKSAAILFALFLATLTWSEYDKFKSFAIDHVGAAILIALLSAAFVSFAFTFNSNPFHSRQRD
jgi:hypothetical protein